MKSIIPEQSQSTTFDTLIQAAMEDFIAEGEVSDPHVITRQFLLFFCNSSSCSNI